MKNHATNPAIQGQAAPDHNTAHKAPTTSPDKLTQLAKLYTMLSVSYGVLFVDMANPIDPYNAACVPGDLRRVLQDALALADFAHALAEGAAQ
ncbi:MAG: hypothetical protein Q8N96_00810 [Methylovulum sp.]|nr:hypothetical protein [Methylovulum sp.]